MPRPTDASKDDLIICSFHTDDDYYTAAGNRLRASLDALDLPHEIATISANGADWIDICRQKIPFLQSVCEKNPDKKVFWIDGDCELDHLPDFIRKSSADVIGFQRGFSTPLKIGYTDRTRFWEPCFWGIGTSEAARAYIKTASEAEKKLSVRATDDFFFEEAWRVHAENLSFQIIPSGLVAGKSDTLAPFFVFGSSGNVAEFKGQAEQHQTLGPVKKTASKTAKPKGPPPSLLVRAGRKLRREAGKVVRQLTGTPAPAKPAPAAKPAAVASRPLTAQKAVQVALAAAKAGDRENAETTLAEVQTRSLLNTYQKNAAIGVQSFLDYADIQSNQPPLNLVWWERPYPGNFGDWLSPLIFHRASGGRQTMFVPPNGKAGMPHLVGIGSIVRFANAQSIVAGAGASQQDAELNTQARYISVRGPITAGLLRDAGGPDVTSFGDPGILMPRVMPILRGATNGRIALVRHYAHRKLFVRLPDGIDEHSITMSDAQTIERFITTLMSYDAIITSAMHVYIICQSYGIPCALVTFATGEGMVHGDGMKYIDYARGAGVPEVAPTVIALDMRGRDFDNLITDHKVSEAKMDEVETALRLAVKTYDGLVS